MNSVCSKFQGRSDGAEAQSTLVIFAAWKLSDKWRKRVGVEPTGDRIACHPPVLKTGTITGPHALPQVRASMVAGLKIFRQRRHWFDPQSGIPAVGKRAR